MSELLDLENSINREMVDVWHHLHQNPELSMQEYKTADFIEKALREKTGVDRIKRVGETGLWVELKGADPERGDIIILRGDMDALPITEQNALPYCSRSPGVMHACGHDVHTSALLGAVRVLEKYRERIHGSIWFFFQPGEESLKGALTFLNDPEIDIAKVKAVAGIHVAGDLESGKVRLKEGPVLASADPLKFLIKGQGGHAAYPHGCRDPLVAAANLIIQLQTLVSRETSPLDAIVLSLCHIQGGSKDNVIPNEISIEGTLRALKKETRTYIQEAIRRICQGIEISLRVSINFEFEGNSLPLYNDGELIKIAEKAAQKALGADSVVFAENPGMAGEDFAFFADKIPGAFIFIGARTKDGPPASGHNPEFYTDEGAVRTGILTLASFALEYFGVDF
ncbi:MAG: amidohydrolase [Treponema sp.]|jgi:amidohydrolase/hippurate hydrolase|nr:amidohydrolase [Treponema sp.]